MTEHAGHHRGDESGQGSHAWNMPSGTDMYDGVSGRQARTSKDCHSQAPNQQPAACRSDNSRRTWSSPNKEGTQHRSRDHQTLREGWWSSS